VAGRINSMKNSNDPIGNGTHDLPAYSAVHQTTAPLHAPYIIYYALDIFLLLCL
jgi:hypothetical protein